MEIKVGHQSKLDRSADTISIFDDDHREIAIKRLQVKRLRRELKKVER